MKYRNELLYSKELLACWLASVKGQNIAALSMQHREWMNEFQREKQAGNLSLDLVLRSLQG